MHREFGTQTAGERYAQVALSCFTKNTPIKTKDGKKKISVLVPGDSIYSYNQKLNISELKPITAIKNYVVAAILALVISNGDTLWATVDHPFFINGKYVAAQELNPGDQFSTYDGSNLFLKEKLSKDTSIQVYHLTVADNANYYVGRNPVLVHNSCFLNHLDNYPVLKATVNDLDEGLKGEFIIDFFKAGDDVLDKLNKSPGMVRAWEKAKFLKPKSNLCIDIDALAVISRQMNDVEYLTKIGPDNFDNIIKNYAGQCKACGPPPPGSLEALKHLPPQDEMLNNLEQFVNNHHGKEGFSQVLNDLSSSDPRKQKGAEFVTRILKDQEGITSFEFKYLEDYDNTADFVLYGTKVDGKSWSVISSIDNIGNSNLTKQLKDYFKEGNFEQWFDYSRFKLSSNGNYKSMSKFEATQHIKKQYRKLFKNQSNAEELFSYMGESNFQNRFGYDNVSDFTEFVVSNLDNEDLFGFIIVK